MNKTTLQHSLAAVAAACLVAVGIVGCGGGKDDPTSVALKPSKVEAPSQGGGGGNGGGTPAAPNENQAAAPAGGVGKITGRIIMASADMGNVPKQEVIKFAIGKAPVDNGFCAAKIPIFDESLIVNPMNGGIQNVFFYLEEAPKGGKKQIESQKTSWPTAEEGKLALDQINCTYKPHAMLVFAGQEFTASSQDSVVHSYKGDPLKSGSFNLTINANESKQVKPFVRPEKYPVSILCATHNWMQGYQLPLDHPYAAVTDADGNFTISDLPSGDYEFVVWHEKGGKVQEYPVTVNAGDNDLGEITINLSQLNK